MQPIDPAKHPIPFISNVNGLLILIVCLVFVGERQSLGQNVVINEVMYHPPLARDDLQYVELMSTLEDEALDLEGWRLKGGIDYTFPKGSHIQPKSFLVIAASVPAFTRHYNLPAMGPFGKQLSHNGERITLVNDAGQVIDELKYSDKAPWPKSPDGYGASLERIQPKLTVEGHRNWAASNLPDLTTATGTPGRPNDRLQPSLPAEVDQVVHAPEHPVTGQAIQVKAAIHDDNGVESVSLVFQVLDASNLNPEQVVPMNAMEGDELNGIYQSTLNGFKTDQLIRYRIHVKNSQNAVTIYPAPESLKPAFSFYVSDYHADSLIPHVMIMNPSGTEQAKRKYDIRASAIVPEPSRGNSTFVFFPVGSEVPEVRDFVRVSRRSGGFKIRFQSREPFQEMTTINLLDEGKPRFALSEYLSFELYRMAGVPAPRSGHYRLRMDGRWMGYQLMVEQVNKAFLRNNERNDEGNLYKLLWYGRNFIQQHEKKTNLDTGHDDIIKLSQALGRLNGDQEWRYIQQHFNVEEFAAYYAVSQCISNWDGFFNNYFVYHDTGNTGKWEMYPWDMDKTWGDYDGASNDYDWYKMPLSFGMEGDRPGGGLFRRSYGPFGGQGWWRPPGHLSGPLLANPGFRQLFLKKLKELLDHTFTPEKMFPVIDALEERLKPEVAFKTANSSRATDQLEHDIETFRNQVRHRRAWLLDNL